MTQTAGDLENTFQRAWTLLVANPIVVVPGLVVSAIIIGIAALVAAIVLSGIVVAGASGSAAAGWMAFALAAVVGMILVVLAAIAQTAFVTGMAGAAWQTGVTRIADGVSALGRSIGEIFIAVLLLVAIGIVAAILAPLTLGLSLLAYFVFFIYAMPAVIIGGHSGTTAIAESCRIAARNFWPTVGVAAIVVCVSLVAAALGSELARVQPFVGGFTSMVVQQVAVAYGTLAIVGEYLKLHPAELPPAPAAERASET